jgi:hypothetical protein
LAEISRSRIIPRYLRLNLGGEAEVPDVINQQPKWRNLSVEASRTGIALQRLLDNGNDFLFCDNVVLPFPDDSVDEVFTNEVPIDLDTHLGPGIQSNEIKRVLKPGARWIDDGEVVYKKP